MKVTWNIVLPFMIFVMIATVVFVVIDSNEPNVEGAVVQDTYKGIRIYTGAYADDIPYKWSDWYEENEDRLELKTFIPGTVDNIYFWNKNSSLDVSIDIDWPEENIYKTVPSVIVIENLDGNEFYVDPRSRDIDQRLEQIPGSHICQNFISCKTSRAYFTEDDNYFSIDIIEDGKTINDSYAVTVYTGKWYYSQNSDKFRFGIENEDLSWLGDYKVEKYLQ